MSVVLPDWIALALFAGVVLAATLYALALSGHFPAEHRRPSLRAGLGRVVLQATMFVTALVALAAVHFALTVLPGYAAVLAAGLAVLVAPMVLKPMPDWIVDDRPGLVLFAGASLLLMLAAHGYVGAGWHDPM